MERFTMGQTEPELDVKLFTFVAGPIENNAYLVADQASGQAMVVDVPFESTEPILRTIQENKLTLTRIILTHGHWDHIGEVMELKNRTGVPLLCHTAEESLVTEPDQQLAYGMPMPIQPLKVDRFLNHGDTISVGALTFQIRHCPGHSPGQIVAYEPTQKICFCGDLIFAGSIGRTDLPGGSSAVQMQSIRDQILTMPDDTRLLSGHGPMTTVGRERVFNPFLRQMQGK